MTENRVKTMMDQLSTAYTDPQVAALPELQAFVLEAATELEKTEDPKLIAVRVCNEIPLRYLENKEQFPKALLTLYYQLKKEAEIYKGVALSAAMMPLWF